MKYSKSTIIDTQYGYDNKTESNYTFIKDIFFKGATWDFYCSDEATPVKFESQISSYKLTAYIMPIQIKGE